MRDRKKWLIGGVVSSVVLVVGLLGWWLYSASVFRVVSVFPTSRTIPTITPYIELVLSEPVKSVSDVKVDGSSVKEQVSVDGKTIRYTPTESFVSGSDYEVVFDNIQASSGKTLNYRLALSAVYMSYASIPEDIRRASVQKSSSGQIDDAFFNNYFPMVTDDFQINHTYDPSYPKPVLFVTFLEEFYNYDTQKQVSVSQSRAEELRKSVLQHIRSKGGTPEKYIIDYKNQYLHKKYGPKDE